MASRTSLSGFPEHLPAERIVEQSFLDSIRRTFELNGFASLETRSVEPLDQLLRKGEIDNEVYVLRRLHAGDDEGDAGLGLHYDLTVPFARYVLENAGMLSFPFRRYQMQRAWRGERPQEGRYREFVQADIDVVDRESLAPHYEIEIPLVVGEALRALPIPAPIVQVNNRKLAEGFFLGAGATDPAAALRAVDKLAKIGPDAVAALLVRDAGLDDDAARRCLDLAAIRSFDTSFAERVVALGVSHPLLDEGLEQLVAVIEATSAAAPGLVMADLRIARGLDYYTGMVYETLLTGYESLGSICSGGRYDSLASDGKVSFPGVGMSIGVSRILGLVLGRGLVQASRSVPSCVLVAVADEAGRPDSERVAAQLRARGIPCEVAPAAAKFGKQIRHADRRGIPYVWFPAVAGGSDWSSVKDIRSGDQLPADPSTWEPPDADRWPTVSAVPANPVTPAEEQTP